MQSTAEKPARSRDENSPGIISIVWESAFEALINTFFLLLFGSIAISMVSGVFHNMTPTAPPGMLAAEADPSPTLEAAWTTLKHRRFAIVFSALFVLTCRTRWFENSRDKGKPEGWAQRVANQLSEDWFDLIVWNAFGALISASIVVALQNISWTQWLWQGLLAGFESVIQGLANWKLGPDRTEYVKRWLGWYSENQLKFTFWLLYFAAICDDLGIPNLKTIGHRIWKRFKARNSNNDQE